MGQQSTDGTNSIGASFRCYVAANAGTFTVPPAVTLALPTGNFGGWDFKTYSYGNFTATGLNFGILQMSFDTPRLRKSEPTGETACPTSLQLLDLPWWGRRFRLPFGTSAECFHSLSMRIDSHLAANDLEVLAKMDSLQLFLRIE